jgi:hypothetical protein
MKRLAAFGSVLSILVSLSNSQEVDSTKMDLGLQLIDIYHSKDKINGAFSQFIDGWFAEIFKRNPQLSSSENAEIRDIVKNLVFSSQERKGGLFDQVALVYAKSFSANELTEIIRFSKTEAGKKYNSMIPALAREGEKVAQLWGAELEESIQRSLSEKYSKKKLKIPQWKTIK